MGAMRALRKRLACGEGESAPFSSACALASIARVPIPKGSLCFFLWHQRKKRSDKSSQAYILLVNKMTGSSMSPKLKDLVPKARGPSIKTGIV